MKVIHSNDMVVGKRYSVWNNDVIGDMGDMEFVALDDMGDPIFKNPTKDHIDFKNDGNGNIFMFKDDFYEKEG